MVLSKHKERISQKSYSRIIGKCPTCSNKMIRTIFKNQKDKPTQRNYISINNILYCKKCQK